MLAPAEGNAAARIHRAAGALIPGYAPERHSDAEFEAFYQSTVMVHAKVQGAFADGVLLGFIALLPGWIDHLYVDPPFHGRGVGSALVRLAQGEQPVLRLNTFQSNARARRFYEWHGFVIEEMTDGQRNEEKMPDITYVWSPTTNR